MRRSLFAVLTKSKEDEFLKAEYVFQNQLELILSAVMPDNRLVLQVMLRNGLRVSDALELKRSDIKRQFWITERKTGKRKQCGLPDWLIAEILSRAGESEWAFPSPVNAGKHRTRQAVWKDLKRVQRAFRIPENIGTHSMRKVYAVDLLEKYGSIDIVRRSLNHDNDTTTMIYAMADYLTTTAPQRRNVIKRRRSRAGA